MDRKPGPPTAPEGVGTAAVSSSKGTDGRPLSEIPPLHLRVDLRPQWAQDRWSLSPRLALTAEAKQNRVVASLGETPTEGWYRLDAGMVVRWGQVRTEFSVENLTNTLYYRHLSYLRSPFQSGMKVYEPGRRLSLGVWTQF